jgi:hypothetical protein
MYSLTKSENKMSECITPKRRIWSMTGKLTLFLTLSIFGLFFIFTCYQYLGLVSNILREENGYIDDDFDDLLNILAVYHKNPKTSS